MSASSFWALKADSVKSTSSSLPSFAEPPPKRAATPPKTKSGLVIKSMAHGAVLSPSPATNGKMSWADSEDDDDFLASFGARKNPAITMLEAAVSQKDARIGELEAHVGTTTVRMEQLETSGADKDVQISNLKAVAEDDQTRIAELQYVVKEKDARIFALEKDNKLQSLHVQELIAEVDEKDRLMATLEKELDNKGTSIRDLEAPSEGLTSASASEVEVPQSKVDPELAPIIPPDESMKPGQSGSEFSFEVVDMPTTGEVTEPPIPCKSPATTVSTVAPKEVEKTGGPAFVNSDFPIFATKETLKVVPPAPAPKKLVFPISWDKYNKTPIQLSPNSSEKKHQSSRHGNDDTAPAWGLAAKAKRNPNAGAPDLNPSLDIRQMPPAKRLTYAHGPEVAIRMGDVKLGSLPKFMLMQCSGKAYKHFNANPEASSFVLPANCMDVEAAKLHINWMDEMTYQGRVYSVTLNTEVKHDLKNLQICRAARVLGLNNTYIGHFTKQLCDRIRNNEITAEFMDLVCSLAVLENDPVFDCLANNLATQRARKAAEFKPDVVTKLEAKHPALAKKIVAITARLDGKHKKVASLPSSTRASSSNGRYTVIR